MLIAGALAVALVLVAGSVLLQNGAPNPAPDGSDIDAAPAPAPSVTSATPTPTVAVKPATGMLPAVDSRVVFFGDSWTAGYAAGEDQGFAHVVAAAFGWREKVYGFSGGGYLRPSSEKQEAFPELARSVQAAGGVELLVVQGGLNDLPTDLDGLDDAIDRTLDTLAGKFPKARVIVVGPASPTFPAESTYAAVDLALENHSQERGYVYVSPRQEEWFTEENVGRYIDASRMYHPNDVGHAYYAERLEDAIRYLGEGTPRE